jgi:hypothetical protein
MHPDIRGRSREKARWLTEQPHVPLDPDLLAVAFFPIAMKILVLLRLRRERVCIAITERRSQCLHHALKLRLP